MGEAAAEWMRKMVMFLFQRYGTERFTQSRFEQAKASNIKTTYNWHLPEFRINPYLSNLFPKSGPPFRLCSCKMRDQRPSSKSKVGSPRGSSLVLTSQLNLFLRLACN